jgi:uncharacterized Zn-binding protein involved in type VI secretion
MKAKVAGVDVGVGPPSLWQCRSRERILRQLLKDPQSVQLEYARPAPQSVPIFEGDDGTTYAVMATLTGPVTVPWIAGSPSGADVSGGGMITEAQLKAMIPTAPSSGSPGPNPKDELKAILEKLGLIPTSDAISAASGDRGRPDRSSTETPEERDHVSGRTARTEDHAATGAAPATGPAAGAAGGHAPAGQGGDGAQSGGKHTGLLDGLPKAGEGAAAQVLAGLIGSGDVPIAEALSGALTTMGINFVVQQLIGSRLEKIISDPKSSTGQIALAYMGPKIAKEVFLNGCLNHFLDGPYDQPAVRVGDADDAGNIVMSGCPNVLIESSPAARDGDPCTGGNPKGTVCQYGAKTVKIGGKIAARKDNGKNPGYGTTVVGGASFTTAPCATRTLIGGPTSNPSPPPPQELDKAATLRMAAAGRPPTGGESSEAGGWPIYPPGTKPTTIINAPGWVWESDLSEWRFWDGTGYSSTMSEVYALPSSWGLVDFFCGKDNLGDYTLLFGEIPLGSPCFPGAGTAGTWWVPNGFFGHDMAGYYSTHDLTYDPRNPATAYDPFAELGVEWNAFLSGIDSAGGPIETFITLPLHVIYSAATTTAGMIDWWGAFMKQLDRDLGLMDVLDIGTPDDPTV